TGMSAAALSQAFTISISIPETRRPVRPAVRTQIWQSRMRRRSSTSTAVAVPTGRTLALFRGVVKRRSRDIVPKSRRAFLVGALVATIAAVIGAPAIGGRLRPPPAAPPVAPPPAGPMVFHAKSCEPRTTRPGDRRCRVVLSADRISVEANATNKQLHHGTYTHVRSVSYSHGFDRPSDTPRVSLRTMRPKSELIVLSFDRDAPARQAVGEIEKRTDKQATLLRETPESAR